MRIAQFAWAPFRLAFVGDFRTGSAVGGAPLEREGVIVRLTTEMGVVGLGEASPLAERGEGTAAEVVELCGGVASGLIGAGGGGLPSLLGALASRSGGRALACGLETALMDAVGRERGVSVSALLASEEVDGVAERVVVNATIGQYDTAAAVRAAVEAVEAGFGTVKLKVGVAESVAAEVRRVVAVREAIGPGVRLRVDANGAWDVGRAVETAAALVGALGRQGLEWIEQPVAAHDIEGLGRVRAEAGVAVAADESAASVGQVEQLVGRGVVDAVVLKPMSIGGLAKTREAALVAQRAGLQVVVTTSIDAGIGTAAALHVAASLRESPAACGLATSGLLEGDLLRASLRVRDGAMALPGGGGLGVELDEHAALTWTDLAGHGS